MKSALPLVILLALGLSACSKSGEKPSEDTSQEQKKQSEDEKTPAKLQARFKQWREDSKKTPLAAEDKRALRLAARALKQDWAEVKCDYSLEPWTASSDDVIHHLDVEEKNYGTQLAQEEFQSFLKKIDNLYPDHKSEVKTAIEAFAAEYKDLTFSFAFKHKTQASDIQVNAYTSRLLRALEISKKRPFQALIDGGSPDDEQDFLDSLVLTPWQKFNDIHDRAQQASTLEAGEPLIQEYKALMKEVHNRDQAGTAGDEMTMIPFCKNKIKELRALPSTVTNPEADRLRERLASLVPQLKDGLTTEEKKQVQQTTQTLREDWAKVGCTAHVENKTHTSDEILKALDSLVRDISTEIAFPEFLENVKQSFADPSQHQVTLSSIANFQAAHEGAAIRHVFNSQSAESVYVSVDKYTKDLLTALNDGKDNDFNILLNEGRLPLPHLSLTSSATLTERFEILKKQDASNQEEAKALIAKVSQLWVDAVSEKHDAQSKEDPQLLESIFNYCDARIAELQKIQ